MDQFRASVINTVGALAVVNIVDVKVFDGSGQVAWRGLMQDYAKYVEPIFGDNLALTCSAELTDIPSCSKNDVMRTAEELGMVSRRGMPKGFLALLPHGKMFESCVDAFNQEHLLRLNVNLIEFPLVFDYGSAPMVELTAPYVEQDRMFALTGPDNKLRLSYAADPNLFAWLESRTLDRACLPYAVYSPQPVFRKFQSGELSIQRTRQFNVPDIHIWTATEDAGTRYLSALELAAEGTNFWFGSDYVHILDSVIGTRHDNEDFYRGAAKAARGITVVRRISGHSKYYSQKTSVVIYSGYGNVMLYNIQMDEINPRRFDITTDDGQFPTVIHACVAMAGSRMLPLILGRGLAGVGPQIIPPELATTQVVFVPVHAEHTNHARKLADSLLASGSRAAVNTDFQRSLGARLSRLRRAWQPLYSVVGDRERETAPLLKSAGRTVADDIGKYVSARAARWMRCRPCRVLGTTPPPIVGENYARTVSAFDDVGHSRRCCP